MSALISTLFSLQVYYDKLMVKVLVYARYDDNIKARVNINYYSLKQDFQLLPYNIMILRCYLYSIVMRYKEYIRTTNIYELYISLVLI